MCFLYGNKDLIILLSRASASIGLYQKLINQFLIGYTSSVTGYTYPQLATLLSAIGYTSSAIGYTCYSKTPTTMGKTYFLLKLLKTLYKNVASYGWSVASWVWC
jgi:hypothetical protein